MDRMLKAVAELKLPAGVAVRMVLKPTHAIVR
jgi:hypothetical protein